MPNQKAVSGPKVVFTLFAGAFLLAGILFTVGYRKKLSDQRLLVANRPGAMAFIDSASTPEKIRAWLSPLPKEWVQVTSVEGQGYVLLVPCYSEIGKLRMMPDSGSGPILACDACREPGEFHIASLAVTSDSAWDVRLAPPSGIPPAETIPTGTLRIYPVSDSLLQHFPAAPFKGRIAVWIQPRASGQEDTALFVPKSEEREFETLRAEDENPEGCGSPKD